MTIETMNSSGLQWEACHCGGVDGKLGKEHTITMLKEKSTFQRGVLE